MPKITLENGTELELTLESYKQLEEQVEEIEQNKEWIPELGMIYYIVDSCGDVVDSCWSDDQEDGFRINLGNCFKTKEEAKKRLKQLQALARVNQEIREKGYRIPKSELEWKNVGQSKFNIYYHHGDKKLSVISYEQCDGGELIGKLKDYESGESLIASHGDDIRCALGIFDK